MKNYIYTIIALLFAFNAQAQSVDKERLQMFIDELKALNSEHVACETENFTPDAHAVFPEGFVSFRFRDQYSSLTGISTSDTAFRYVRSYSDSPDKTGYLLMRDLLDKYYDLESEDIFGIPLLVCQREDGAERTVFMDESNTLVIMDDGYDEMEIIYVGFNLMNSIKRTLQSNLNVFGAEYVDVDVAGGMEFSVKVTDADEFVKDDPSRIYVPSADSKDILALARKIYEDNALMLENELAKAKSEERREEIAEFKDEQKEALEELERELGELSRPSFIEIVNGSDEHYVAIPAVPDHLKERQKPYAANGVYDWINRYYSFRAGAKVGITDIISCIITPHDVAMQYVMRNYPRNKWLCDGFTAEYKKFAATEYQGGTPAVLYCFPHTEEGYNEIMREFDYLFKLETGDKVYDLEVTQQSKNNGKRFVQLWGEGGILMCLLDSPADKYCHMSIIIGGVTGFEQAVNEYVFGGEKDFAKKCNIIIDSDLSDNSYGIHFTDKEYFCAGKSHKNGVHIDFGYARKFTE